MGIVGFLISWLIKNRRVFFRSKGTMIRVALLLIFVIQACFFQEGANTVAHLGGFITGFVLGLLNVVVFKNDKMMEGLA
jgi:rhomboid protease GluP